MGFEPLTVLIEGVWSSITGGWHYDKKQSHISNLFHLYVWLIFLCWPFITYLFFNTFLSWFLYCTFIGVIFLIIKSINQYFHYIFDYGKCIKIEASHQQPSRTTNTKSPNCESEEKDALEMVTISNNFNSNDGTNISCTNEDKLSNSLLKDSSKESTVNQQDLSEIVSTTIDLKADVHCNDTDSSSSINLSLLFRGNEGESAFTSQMGNGVKKGSFDIVSNSNTSLSHIASVYTKTNLSNTSIGMVENVKYGTPCNFRRARSELETVKLSDRYSKPKLVPPSHPVSLEVINSRNYIRTDDEAATLDTSRFNQDSGNKLNRLDLRLSNKRRETTPQAAGDEMSEEAELKLKMNKIDETSEKTVICSSTYIKDCDSSEDGDESDVSLYTADLSKSKNMPARKLTKQPLRKTRFISHRKRTSSKSSGSRVSHSEWPLKNPYEHENHSRVKPNSIVLLSTSDEEDIEPRSTNTRHTKNRFETFVSSDSSSFLPSSSSLSSLSSKKDQKTDPMETFSLNTPSTSSGITNSNRGYSTDSRRLLKKARNRARYYQDKGTTRIIEDEELAKDLIERQIMLEYNHLHSNSNFCELPDSGIALEDSYQSNEARNSIETELMRYLVNTHSRSSSMREVGSSKNSIVCLPNSSIIPEILSLPGTHLASSHEDTSVGAVHVFQDERGNWYTYTFDENSTGVARGLFSLNPFPSSKISCEHEKFLPNVPGSSSSIFYLNNCLSPIDQSTVICNNANNSCGHMSSTTEPFADFAKLDSTATTTGSGVEQSSHIPGSLVAHITNSSRDNPGDFFLDVPLSTEFFSALTSSHQVSYQQRQRKSKRKKSYYYQVNLFNRHVIRLDTDRLTLLAFLDRNISLSEMFLSIILAIMVSIFSAVLLTKNFFHDLSLFVFCVVVASSQYTLLKSVQPDAASPTHGFNRITIYSRPIYFCILSSLLLLMHSYLNLPMENAFFFEIYGVNIFDRSLISAMFRVTELLLLSFPLLFTLGMLPQINTFVIYVCEQFDIHLFGGTASTMGIVSSVYSITRSILILLLLYLLANLLNIKETSKASFSVFCGLLVAISYHLSRCPTDPSLYWSVVCSLGCHIKNYFQRLMASIKKAPSTLLTSRKESKSCEVDDPLPGKLRKVAAARLESDLISCILMAVTVFSVHVSSIFKLQPMMNCYTMWLAIFNGFMLHYVLPQCRKQLPWQCFANPLLKPHEFRMFEVKEPVRIMWFERMHTWMRVIEKNVILLTMFLSYITTDCPLLIKIYGNHFGIFLLVLCAFKCIRSTFNDSSNSYIVILFTYLFFTFDFKFSNGNVFILNYFIISIVFYKVDDLLLKLRFVITYVAPWQITWGSAFHAFAQPFSVPHSAMLLVQILLSSLLSSPLQPLLGSAIFLTSYVRPIKFWERDYNTKRVDHSNTRLASQLDKTQTGSDDNNLNSIFYEHLNRSLQETLYGDLALGRWGDVRQGDCFVMASENLNCLVHIIELGNGFVTFQMRGLEFRGTYCQQREVEAITENVSDDEGCCCCETGHFKGFLSINAAFNQRWLSWEVTHTNYVLDGYSISENTALTMLQPYDLRKGLISFCIKSIIYYCITHKNLSKWIENEELQHALSNLNDMFVDLDPTFNINLDEDYDQISSGVTRLSFKLVFLDWIKFCMAQVVGNSSDVELIQKNEEYVVSLCLGLSLVFRRALGTAAHHNAALLNADFFLHGYYTLFKGDFRIHCTRDEWIFLDMDFLNRIIAPAIRMSLKLHQDQFVNFEELENYRILFDVIGFYAKTLVISHEADPVWRKAILTNASSLLTLRHVVEDGSDHFKVIMLNTRLISFRVIKINRECVRGLWAGQQQELIFIRNRNPERGSIQNAKQVLRNLINSSCDQPIGYPIYVSPLTTSFAETSNSLPRIIGHSLNFSMFTNAIGGFFQKIRNRCREVCQSTVQIDHACHTVNTSRGSRLTKSDSSDKGIDDLHGPKNPFVSVHTPLSNFQQFMKLKAMQAKKEEEMAVRNATLVNLSANRNIVTMLANNMQEPPSVGVSPNFPKPVAETSFVNVEQSRSVIVEKSIANAKGDAV